jgi:hypothetical protein
MSGESHDDLWGKWNVVDNADDVERRLRKLWLAHREMARWMRRELLALMGLPERLRAVTAELPIDRLHENLIDWLYFTLPQQRRRVLSPYEHALADAICVTVAMQQAPAQTDELIGSMHAALMRCQVAKVAAAAIEPRAEGGRKKGKKARAESERLKVKTHDLKAQGLPNKQIAPKVGRSESWVSRTLREPRPH